MTGLSGLDLCAIPAALPPQDVVPNLVDPPSLAPIIIPVTTVIMSSAALITAGRLFANRMSLGWSDYLATLGLAFSLSDASLMLYQLRTARHAWDIPLCWVVGGAMKHLLARSALSITGMFLAKMAILLLFHQLFAIGRCSKIAIRSGMVIVSIVFIPNIAYQFITLVPRHGMSWDDVALSGQSEMNSAFWPIVLKASAVFSTGLWAVIATTISLVFRVHMAAGRLDRTWKAALVLLCVIIEAHITIIVSSMPGFLQVPQGIRVAQDNTIPPSGCERGQQRS
ncbi:hypothetical protein VTI74DRAFT_7793 [Chaetomium olivicolor]